MSVVTSSGRTPIACEPCCGLTKVITATRARICIERSYNESRASSRHNPRFLPADFTNRIGRDGGGVEGGGYPPRPLRRDQDFAAGDDGRQRSDRETASRSAHG